MAADPSDAAKNAERFIPVRARYLAEKQGAVACPAFNPGKHNPGPPPVFYIPDELVVGDEDMAGEVADLLGKLGGGERLDAIPGSRAILFRVNGDAQSVAQQIKRVNPEIVVGPHHMLTLAQIPKIGPDDDPSPVATGWSLGPATKNEPPAIAVVDTGIWKKPQAKGLETYQQIGDPDPIDAPNADGVIDWYGAAHGGFIAGVIASRLGNASVYSENAFEDDRLTELSVIRQVEQALKKDGTGIVNLSLGSYRDAMFGTDLVFLNEAMARWATQYDVLFVAAAGNDGIADEFFPAAFAADVRYADCVVSVGALESTAGAHSRPAGFSNNGAWVNAWAPGVDIVSHYPAKLTFEYRDAQNAVVDRAVFDHGYAEWSGTSFAAPYVAAEIAKYAAERGCSAKAAWAEIRGDRPFVVFWPEIVVEECAPDTAEQTAV